MSQKKGVPVQIIRLSILGVLVVGYIAFKVVTGNIVESKVNKLVSELPKGLVTYESASMDLLGFAVHIDNLVISMPNQKDTYIDEIIISDIDTDNNVPQYADIEISGINVDMDALRVNKQMSKMIDTLGYQQLKSNIAVNYTFDKDKKMLDIKGVSFGMDDAGELTFKTKILGVKSLKTIANTLQRNPSALEIDATSLTYDDDSLTERLYKLAGQNNRKKQSADEFKAELISELDKEIKKAKSKKFEKEVLEAMREYLQNPKSFEVSISPDNPISMKTANKTKSKEEFLELLNFEVSVN